VKIKIFKFKKKNITKKYLSWLNNKRLLNYSRHKKINYSKKKAIKFYENVLNTSNFFFAIKDTYKNKIIGTSIVYNLKQKSNIGILIGDKNYRNKGLAFKAITLLYKELKKRNIYNLEIGCDKKNISMIKVAKKLGFKKNFSKKNEIYFKKIIS